MHDDESQKVRKYTNLIFILNVNTLSEKKKSLSQLTIFMYGYFMQYGV